MELTLAYIAGGIFLVGLALMVAGFIHQRRYGSAFGPKGEWPLSRKLIIAGPVLWTIASLVMVVVEVKSGKWSEVLLGALLAAFILWMQFAASRKK
jgi:hypothetical protein